jgi:hypothetical protein
MSSSLVGVLRKAWGQITVFFWMFRIRELEAMRTTPETIACRLLLQYFATSSIFFFVGYRKKKRLAFESALEIDCEDSVWSENKKQKVTRELRI